MYLAAIKIADQQAILMLHPARGLLVQQRTVLINALHAHMAEFGSVAARGQSKIRELIVDLRDDLHTIQEIARAILFILFLSVGSFRAAPSVGPRGRFFGPWSARWLPT
ncbi:MAG: hypothetical protein ACKVKF_16650 [Rhodobacterales bacterium]|uniref:transposase n=1 Tax=Puniceibacterium antarcticum TaxID=1206336 RepID=UPI00117A29AB